MKKYLLILVLTVCHSCATVSKKASVYKEYSPIEADQCVLYVSRDVSMLGGSVAWPLGIIELNKPTGEFLFADAKDLGKMKQMGYKPLVLKANTFYYMKMAFGIVIFSGTRGSESVAQFKGAIATVSTIKGQALARTNAKVGFKLNNEEVKSWAKSVENAESYNDLSAKQSLQDFKFEFLNASENSPIYAKLKTMRIQ